MYFESRTAAGRELAKQISKKYKGNDSVVVALSDGGVMIGAQIAWQVHCALTMLASEAIQIPRENAALAGVSQDGSFAYNQRYSSGEIEEFVSEYYHYIEQEKVSKVQELHRSLGSKVLIKRSMIQDRNVILVSDGLKDSFPLDVAMQYLKPIRIKKLIIVTPLASIPVVDRMHILADDIFCLSVLEDYMDNDHYYDTQDVPSHEKVVRTVAEIVANWK